MLMCLYVGPGGLDRRSASQVAELVISGQQWRVQGVAGRPFIIGRDVRTISGRQRPNHLPEGPICVWDNDCLEQREWADRVANEVAAFSLA